MGEKAPKTELDSLIQEMESQGFTYYKTDSLYETRGVSGRKDPSVSGFIFKSVKVQTEEELIENFKNKPEFSEVRDKLEVKLIPMTFKQGQQPESFYIFVNWNFARAPF